MSSAAPNFDGLARSYRALEFLAFGRDLERARFCLLGRLAGCRDILVLGEGDGRCLARLVRAAPLARIRCVDASGAMLARAAARLTDPADRARVTFEQGDALALDLPAGRHDAVVTLFFLDCLLPDQVERLVARVQGALRPGASWLWADFAVPAGWRRGPARAALRLLYFFFRWQTGLPARELPPAEAMLGRAGFRREDAREFRGGFIRAALLRGPAPRP